MTTVVATGTFEILHPGHVLFLKEAKKLGDKLVVIVSTDKNARMRKGRVLIPQEQRLEMVKALKFVDNAVIGDEKDIFKPIKRIRPDIIALGRNQKFREKELEAKLKARGINARVVRIKKFWKGELSSSSKIVGKIKEK
jgi:FAD synthetase